MQVFITFQRLLVPIIIVRFPNKLDAFSFILELIDTWAILYHLKTENNKNK